MGEETLEDLWAIEGMLKRGKEDLEKSHYMLGTPFMGFEKYSCSEGPVRAA